MTNPNDNAPWGLYARCVVGMVAVALMLDGLDAQVLGLAIPSLIQDWQVTRADLTPVTAGSLIGMALGATFGGWFGDRFGRRTGLILSLALFGLATAIASQVQGLVAFGALRTLAGLGLGAALPNGTALITEFTPERHRSLGASIAMLSQPVGSMVAGLVAAAILASAGWRGLFLIGGLAPLLVALLFLKWLPESPRFLARQQADTVVEPGTGERASLGVLLTPAWRRDSVLLWVSGFMSLLALYTMLSWGPAMLAAAGFPLAFAGTVVAVFSVGGICGSLTVGLLARRIGSRGAQALIGGVGIGAAAVLCLLFSAGQPGQGTVLALMAGIGFCAAGSQTTLYVLSSHLYPTWLRATGIGATLGLGRFGAVASAWAGAYALDLGGPVAFFLLFALAIAVATLGCAAISRPVRPT
jgi:MFS transporter, AAHS family, 4-hydroxybenzoate transporter